MTRSTLAALAAATLFLASASLAETPSQPTSQREVRNTQRYMSTAERWQGRPALRATSAHPFDEASPSEKVYEQLPAVNFLVEGQNPGGFQVPQL